MGKYIIQQGDTFDSLTQKFRLEKEGILKNYPNLLCSVEDIMPEPILGKTIYVPNAPELIADDPKVRNSYVNSQQQIYTVVNFDEFKYQTEENEADAW